MSIPTFDDTDLFDEAARDKPGCWELRVDSQHMPGVDGQFVQSHGLSGRTIEATGRISQTGATAAEAHQALKASLADKQALADCRTIASYSGTDGVEYPYCFVQSFQMIDAVEITRLSDTSVMASCRCRALLRQLSD